MPSKASNVRSTRESSDSYCASIGGTAALTDQYRLARLRVRANQVEGTFLGHAVGPIGLVAASVLLLLRVDNLKSDDLIPHIAHRHQDSTGARGVTHAHADDLFTIQVGATALLRHTLEQARGTIGSTACSVRSDLGGAAFTFFLASAHNVTLLLAHAPGLDLDLVAVARTPITEATKNQRLVFLGAMLMDHIPAVFLFALVLRGLAAGQLAEREWLRRLKAVVSELTENVIEHNG